MRRISLDTETTGLDPSKGHKIIEIGCVELSDNIPTGSYWHKYINPGRKIDEEAKEVHGITEAFLNDKPKFVDIAEEFLLYIKDAELIIHNAKFDLGFINTELESLNLSNLEGTIYIDTLKLAKQKHPGSSASLDSLCRRFNIDISRRKKHGALLDAELLSEVYLELTGGRQKDLGLLVGKDKDNNNIRNDDFTENKFNYIKRKFNLKEEDLKKHNDLVKKIKNALWEVN